MKTHEIGIGSFASLMMNGKEKHWDSRQRGEGEKLHFLCARLNVHDHVHLMKKASKEDWKKQRKEARMNGRKKAHFAYSRCYLKTLSLVSSFTCDQMWSVCLGFRASRTPRQGCTPENSTHQSCFRKNQLNKKEPGQNQPVLSAPLCSAKSWWSFQVAHKLAHNNSRLHRNYILLTARSFTCDSAVCVYSAWTRLEPPVSPSGLWLREEELCVVHLSVVWGH